MKKVLMVAYVFPPAAGPAVWRTLKFVKYLPEFGWQPYVLTARSPENQLFDPALLDEVPAEARVYRTAALPMGRWIGKLSGLLRKRRDSPEYAGSRPEEFGESRPLPVRVLRALGYGVLVPDTMVGWVPFAVAQGVNLVLRHKIDAVYATGTPFSDFLAGYIISVLTGRPLILDYRDLWTIHPGLPSEGWLNDSLDRMWERRFFNRARHVLFTAESWIPAYQELYPHIPSEKLHFIPHGYDPQDFEGLVPQGDSTRFTISHVGSVYHRSRPDIFLTALRMVLDRRPELKPRIRVQFIGTGGFAVQEWVDKLGLQEAVELKPYVDHRSSLQYLLDSDLLLLLNPSPPEPLLVDVPGKTYEYLASGKPILAVTPEGSLADLIRDTNAGTAVTIEDVDGIARALETYYDAFAAGNMPSGATPESVLPFQRREETRQFADLLDAATDTK